MISLRLARLTAFLMAALLALNASLAFAQGGNSPRPKKEKWDYLALTRVPEKARERRNPLQNDPDAQAAGGKLFEQHCAECHGMKAEGGQRGPSLLREEVQQASPGAIFWILTNGIVRHGMPVWSKLPEAERWQIVTFVKSFSALGGPQPSPSRH